MPTDIALTQLAEDVARDLQRTPKQLQAQYLYDALGTSLFEAICNLPWYRITRAEQRLIQRHAPDIAAALATESAPTIVELGVGTGEKLATVASAVATHAADVQVHVIDISAAALDITAARLSTVPGVMVTRHQGTYEEGLARVSRATEDDGRKLVLFLGSNIGNFDRAAAAGLLRAIRARLTAGDYLLLGADLVKPVRDLLLAYDDPLGVTAAFNKNLLVRLNRELNATFALAAFDHRAVWNDAEQRVEMHLVSRDRQSVDLPAINLRIHFAAGESIWTESSYKYTETAIVGMGANAGFAATKQWVDGEARFALTLLQAR